MEKWTVYPKEGDVIVEPVDKAGLVVGSLRNTKTHNTTVRIQVGDNQRVFVLTHRKEVRIKVGK